MIEEEFNKLPTYELEATEDVSSTSKKYYTWAELTDDINDFCKLSVINENHFTGVYGLPRGGLIPAVMISHKLDIPLLMAPCEGCLIVDDIADSGRSLSHYSENDTQFNRHYIFTLFYAKRSIVKPHFYSRFKKHDEWVIFPWEEHKQC